ncbi:MAG: hypothetical protein LBR79_03715 [Oscillospiraceae bacterium]|nr:hypothetical protein [Oscillospiraceae bacterium]
MYFLPAVGREKVIKIRRFSNETAIFLNKIFAPAHLLDLSVNFTDCNQNRRRRMKILQGDFDAKPFFQ